MIDRQDKNTPKNSKRRPISAPQAPTKQLTTQRRPRTVPTKSSRTDVAPLDVRIPSNKNVSLPTTLKNARADDASKKATNKVHPSKEPSKRSVGISKAEEILRKREQVNASKSQQSDKKVLENRPSTTISLPDVNITMEIGKKKQDKNKGTRRNILLLFIFSILAASGAGVGIYFVTASSSDTSVSSPPLMPSPSLPPPSTQPSQITPSPPTSLLSVVTLEFVAQGDISTFDANSVKEKLLDKFTNAIDVVVTVTPASVKVQTKILFSSASFAQTALTELKEITITELSSDLGVVVQSKTEPVLTTEVASPPSPSPPPSCDICTPPSPPLPPSKPPPPPAEPGSGDQGSGDQGSGDEGSG